MKIYEIGTGYTPIPAQISAATEIVVEELTKAMLKQGMSVQIIDIESNDRAETKLPILEVPVAKIFSRTDVALGILHKMKRVAYSISLARELKKIIKQSDENVVFHFHNQYNLFFFLKLTSSKLRRKCLIAYTNHSGIWRLPWNEISDTIKKRYFQEAECMKKADVVFVLNEETKVNAVEYLKIPRSHFVVIANGVNTDKYCSLSENEKLFAKKQFGLQKKKVILQVGSIYENKGQTRSIELLASLLKKNPELTYAYVGGIVSDEYHEKVKALIKELEIEKQVVYLGMVSPGKELNLLYNASEATIFSSEYEGFSLVIVESLAAGVPVLINKKTPFSVGAGCVLYEEKMFSEIVEEKILSSEDRYELLCEDARKNAVNKYSWENISKDYLKYFDEIKRNK